MKRLSDLNPPLGHPGGPCYVVKRIMENVHDPHLRDQLIKEIEEGDSLTNPEAAKVYGLDVEPGTGPVQQLVLGPHAQYRADLRGVNVPVIRAAVQQFLKQMNDWKSRKDWHYDRTMKLLDHGEGVDFMDPRTKLTIVFTRDSSGRFKLVTTYWGDEPKQSQSPVHCVLAGYTPPDEDLSGYKTLVKSPGDSREPDSVLPSPPNSRSKPTGKPYYNVPPASEDAPEGRNLHKDRARTLGVPGGDGEHPWIDNSNNAGGYHQVRPDVQAAMKGHPTPGTHKQRNQLSQAKSYYQRRYRAQKGKIKQKAKKWYARYKNDNRLKRDRERRRDHPNWYSRKPNSGYRKNEDRSRDYREEQKTASEFGIPLPFWFRPADMEGYLIGADPDSGKVIIQLDNQVHEISVDIFFDEAVFESSEDIDKAFDYLDEAFDDVEGHTVTASQVIAEEMGDWARRQEDEVTPPDQRFNRGDEPESTWPDKIPAEYVNNIHAPDDNGGSAKVIPEGHNFVNKEASRLSELLGRCDSGLHSKAEGIKVQLKRVDPAKLLWLFHATGSKGDIYKVKVKAVPSGNIRDVNKVDLKISCSCPYWRWQGPEYHAQQNGYLLGRPVGLATQPNIKDPGRTHGLCKHALAVLGQVSKFVLPERVTAVPQNKSASLSYLADSIVYGEVTRDEDPLVKRIASRYLLKVK